MSKIKKDVHVHVINLCHSVIVTFDDLLWHFGTQLYNTISCPHYQNISFWYKKLISIVSLLLLKTVFKHFMFCPWGFPYMWADWLIRLKMGNAVSDCMCTNQNFSYETFGICKSCTRVFKCGHDSIFELRFIYVMYI